MELDFRQEQLFRAIGGVGSDLIDTAEQRRFQPGPLRKYGPVAAGLLLLIGLSWLAAPYFFKEPPESAVLAVPAESEAPLSEEAQQSTEAGEVQLPLVPDVSQEQIAIQGEIAARQELVFWDTVYYVEAQYTAQEAAGSLGELLGTVQRADAPELAGAAVCGRLDASVRTDSSSRQVPLEIFVENQAGYLYCLTYYYSDLPLMQWDEVEALWQQGQVDALAQQLVLVPELASAYGQVQWSGGALTPTEQAVFFQVTLQMERQHGARSEDLLRYLWKQDGGYVVPVEDIYRQLKRYLGDFTWVPEALPGYSAEYHAVLFPSLALCSDQQMADYVLPAVTGNLDEANRSLTLTVPQTDSEARSYTITFDEDRMLYSQIGVAAS